MTACARNNVHIAGTGERAMMFAHGFGCDQNMWRYVAPAFEDAFGQSCLIMSVRAGRTSPPMTLPNTVTCPDTLMMSWRLGASSAFAMRRL